jgi:hypothetical protein
MFVISIKLTEMCDYIIKALRNQNEVADLYANLFGLACKELCPLEIKNEILRFRQCLIK